ncbi:MAG: helix-turn-helix domain-containing protein [Clostridia bacterium]|nr:helix-turn-helix domain-containing protein [Clostridia bacterium]
MSPAQKYNDASPRDERLPFILATVGELEKQPPITRTVGPNWNQLIWIKRGEGIFTIDGQSYTLGEGQGMLMRHGYPHSYQGKELGTAWCTFFCAESLLDYTIGERSHLVFTVPDFLEEETEELCRLAQSSASTLALSAAGYTYIAEVLAAITKERDDVVDAIKSYLRSNLTQDLSLDEIARHIGMSKYALCHYYKEHRGRSIMEELKHARIAHAKRLLRYSSESVEEIGRLCGYDSHSYFSMRFREICGCSPSEYRKRYL